MLYRWFNGFISIILLVVLLSFLLDLDIRDVVRVMILNVITFTF